MSKNIIRCSQCYDEFPGGYEYRMHWNEYHFYPYLRSVSFDDKTAQFDARYRRHIDRLIREISSCI